MEKLRIREVIGVSLVLGLGLTACGSYGDTDAEKITKQEAVSNEDDVQVTHEYTPTGKRITSYDAPSDEVYNTKFSYCDGEDLVEEVRNYSDGGGASLRSVDHPACDDGFLTPADFETPKLAK